MPLLVIETKRKVPFIDRKFDPYSKDVIKQSSGYAVELGAPYFATCNGEVLVLFDTFTAGVPLPQRRLKHYKVSFNEEFAKTLLEEVCRFRIGVGKWLELDDVFLQRLRNAREKIKKKKEIEPEKDIGLEMADILFSLICLANHYGIDLESKFKEVMEKYSTQDAGRWTKKSKTI